MTSRGGACQACGVTIEIYWGRGASRPYGLFEIDHITPLQFGGSDDLKNMAVLCPCCHRRKSQREAILGTSVCAVHGVAYDPASDRRHGVKCLRPPPNVDLAPSPDFDLAPSPDFSAFAYVPVKPKAKVITKPKPKPENPPDTLASPHTDHVSSPS